MTTKELADELGLSAGRMRMFKKELNLVQGVDWNWSESVNGGTSTDFTEAGAEKIRQRNTEKHGRPPNKKPSS